MTRFFVAAMFVAALFVTSASAQTTCLVNEGDFEQGGANWGFAGVGVDLSFPTTGGNTGGYAQMDQSAANWGGVLINDGDSVASLASLGLTAGDEVTFCLDMIDLNPGNGGVTAGMKVENWAGGGFVNDSGDVTFALTDSWETYSFTFTIDGTSDGMKFVPLMVGQAVGSSVGFDNISYKKEVVPEPTTAGLLALGVVGLISRRRRS